MKYNWTIFIAVFALGLTACASTPEQVGPNQYSVSDIAIVMSAPFDARADALERALAPSYAKFGAPKAYITGLMSLPGGEGDKRLLGTGEHYVKHQLPRGTFWEIQGSGFAPIEGPMNAVHLLYDKSSAGGAQGIYTAMQPQYRRGATFTVFERVVDGRIIVTVYKTENMPKQAELNGLSFAPIASQSRFELFQP